jgi:hypothetical protein
MLTGKQAAGARALRAQFDRSSGQSATANWKSSRIRHDRVGGCSVQPDNDALIDTLKAELREIQDSLANLKAEDA